MEPFINKDDIIELGWKQTIPSPEGSTNTNYLFENVYRYEKDVNDIRWVLTIDWNQFLVTMRGKTMLSAKDAPYCSNLQIKTKPELIQLFKQLNIN